MSETNKEINQVLVPLMNAQHYSLFSVINALAQAISENYSTVRPDVVELLKIAAGLSAEE